MNRKKNLREKYFKEHNIDDTYQTIECEIHHIVEFSEAEKGLVPKQEIDRVANLLLISKIKHDIITARTNQFRESNIGQDNTKPRKYYKIEYEKDKDVITLININDDVEKIELKIGEDIFLRNDMIPIIMDTNEQLLKKYF